MIEFPMWVRTTPCASRTQTLVLHGTHGIITKHIGVDNDWLPMEKMKARVRKDKAII